jgi:beta-lactam-binding protein with PASTA domain/serine/threonine protein kinase
MGGVGHRPSLPDTPGSHEPGLTDLRTYTWRVDIAVTDALVGRLVDGRYRVRSRIARGGMATVYEAADERLNRDVALKVMHPDLAEDDEFVQRFIAEARAAASLSRDRSIVTVFDQGATDGVVWLALELVRGRTLRWVITERGRLDPSTALAIIEPVLTALAAAHRAGIVHRDVKPENVLVGDDGHVQVADFGLAHAVTNAPQAARGAATRGMLLGTVAYISPEQALGAPATQASDVYAAGVLLYELLTGHPPHDGPTDYVVVRKHVDEDVPPPSDEVPGVPAEVDALVTMATARHVPERFPDAGAFLSAVRRVRRGIERDRHTSGPILGALVAAGAAGAGTNGSGSEGTGGPGSAPARRSDTNPIHHSTTSLDPLPVDPAAHPTVPPSDVPREADLLEAPLGGAADGEARSDAGRGDTSGGGGDATASLARAGGLDGEPTPGADSGDGPLDPFVTPPTAPRRKRRLRRLALMVVLVGVIGGAGWWWLEGRLVPTPTLVGMTVAQAEQAADAQDLAVVVVGEEYSESIPAEAVVATDPSAGSRVAPGETIGLVVSLGPERYDVPSLSGLTRDEAEAALDELTLVPGEVTRRFHEEVPQGQVISQSPAAGTEVKRAAEVSYVVSRGRRPIEVPDVTGQSRADAVAQIEDARLTASVGEAFSDDVAKGRVLSQDPSDGTLFRGDTVSIVVSLGPETIEIPDVEGKDADAAKAELEAAGLNVRSVVLLPAGPNNVLRQSPAEGTTVRVGSDVTIYIF